MRVLAVDPGYHRLGVAVVKSDKEKEELLYSGCLVTDQGDTLAERFVALGLEFEALLLEYKPDAVAIEKLFFNQNQKTAMAVAEARGVVIYLAGRAGCLVYEFGPQEIKIAITGYGKSSKKQVFLMLRRLISGVPEKAFDDEHDAIAIGLTALASKR